MNMRGKMARSLVKRYMIYSIISFLASSGLIPISLVLQASAGFPYGMIFGFAFLTITGVSAIFYGINPEIMFGMVAGTSKYQHNITRNTRIGRAIQVGILTLSVVIAFAVYVLELIYNLLF